MNNVYTPKHGSGEGDLPAIFRVVSLEQAAQYMAAVEDLKPAADIQTFRIHNYEDVMKLAAAQATHELSGKKTAPSERAIELIGESMLRRMMSIEMNAIGVIVRAANAADIEGLPFVIERLAEESTDSQV